MIGTSACLKEGQWLSFKDLLYGAMLPSGNDAAYLLAEYVGYLLVNRLCDVLSVQGNGKLDLTQ